MGKICIVGAFDRYNYGDILFPIIIERYIKENLKEKYKNYSIEFYGLKESDLTSIKGIKTKSIKYLKEDIDDGNNIIIVAGGDVLPVRISFAFSDLIENKLLNKIISMTKRIIGNNKFEEILIKAYRIPSKFPWIVNNIDRSKNNKVYYNAVGASTIYKLPKEDLNTMKYLLKYADYISVRDKKSCNNLNVIGIQPEVFPDSAIIMSQLYNNEFFENNISYESKKFVEKNLDYICFQINKSSFDRNKQEVIKQLKKLKNQTSKKILLLPIGKANNHNDLDALREIKIEINSDYYLPENLNIYDIMYLISKASLFIGTSLHGNITALSYGVPHLGIDKSIEKLDSFLKTWDIDQINGCIDIGEISQRAKDIINIDRNIIVKKSDSLIKLANINFKNMFLEKDTFNE